MALVISALLALAPDAALAHGASKGLHLHVDPDPATPGQTVTVELTAEAPIRALRVGFAGHDPIERRPDPPRRNPVVELKVPEDAAAGTLSLQAEATTAGGKVLRASAVLRIEA